MMNGVGKGLFVESGGEWMRGGIFEGKMRGDDFWLWLRMCAVTQAMYEAQSNRSNAESCLSVWCSQ